MTHKVVRYLNNPNLEKPAVHVAEHEFDTPELHQLVEDMFETMYASRGLGLAAPQVDVHKRLTVIDTSGGEPDIEPNKVILINPEIIHKEGKQTGEEGCLSIPGFREDVRRHKRVRIRARNAKGEVIEVEGEDLMARAMQHEIDHLNGILFLTHLSPLKREIIKRKIKKLIQAGEWD
jgi:peptide deformylase